MLRAKRRGRPCTISASDVEELIESTSMVCPVLGIKMRKSDTGKPDMWSPTLDEITVGLGYTKENTRLISHRANSLKSNGTLEEFKAIVAYMEKEQNG